MASFFPLDGGCTAAHTDSMTTLTLRLSEGEKQQLEEQAATAGKPLERFILDATGISEQKRGTIYEAMEDLKHGRYDEFDSLEELFADWKRAVEEDDED